MGNWQKGSQWQVVVSYGTLSRRVASQPPVEVTELCVSFCSGPPSQQTSTSKSFRFPALTQLVEYRCVSVRLAICRRTWVIGSLMFGTGVVTDTDKRKSTLAAASHSISSEPTLATDLGVESKVISNPEPRETSSVVRNQHYVSSSRLDDLESHIVPDFPNGFQITKSTYLAVQGAEGFTIPTSHLSSPSEPAVSIKLDGISNKPL